MRKVESCDEGEGKSVDQQCHELLGECWHDYVWDEDGRCYICATCDRVVSIHTADLWRHRKWYTRSIAKAKDLQDRLIQDGWLIEIGHTPIGRWYFAGDKFDPRGEQIGTVRVTGEETEVQAIVKAFLAVYGEGGDT